MMTIPSADDATEKQEDTKGRRRLEWLGTWMKSAHGLALLYLVFVSALIALRAIFNDRFGFLGMPWMLALALVPLIPWLVPAVSPWMRRVAPSIESFKLGVLEVQLRQSQPQVASLGSVAAMLTDPTIKPLRAAGQEDFHTTHAQMIVAGMQAIRKQGAEVTIVDLEAGAKWRYPNLYFLARLLEADMLTRCMVFTEARGGEGGYFVVMCAPGELRARFEAAFPPYAEAGTKLAIPAEMTAPNIDVELKRQFDAFREVLTESAGRFSELEDWVTSNGLIRLLATGSNRIAVESKDVLADEDFRTILLSPFRYIAVTSGGQFRSVIDQVPVALAFAKAALARPTSVT